MATKKREAWGTMLFLAYPVFELCYPFLLIVLPTNALNATPLGDVLCLVLRHSGLLAWGAKFGSIVGILLLAQHHRQSADQEWLSYRRLDRLVAVILLASLILSGIPWLLIPDLRPFPYVGALFLIFLAVSLLLCLLTVGWAAALWRAQGRYVLLFSTVCAVVMGLPPVPANNPQLLAEINASSDRLHSSMELGGEELDVPPSAAESSMTEETATNADVVPRTTATVSALNTFRGRHFGALLLLAYTCMRLGRTRAHKQQTASLGYRAAELFLTAQLPFFLVWHLFLWGYFHSTAHTALGVLQGCTDMPFAINLLLILLQCIAFYYVYWGTRNLAPERSRKTDRLLGAGLMFWVFCLFFAAAITTISMLFTLMSTTPPFFLLRIFGGALCLTAWGWGLVYARPLWAIGGLLGCMGGMLHIDTDPTHAAFDASLLHYTASSALTLLAAYTCVRFSDLHGHPQVAFSPKKRHDCPD